MNLTQRYVVIVLFLFLINSIDSIGKPQSVTPEWMLILGGIGLAFLTGNRKDDV